MNTLSFGKMKLSELAKHKNIVLQSHNIPDADSVSSAFVLQAYFEMQGCKAKIVYGGPAKITKPSLLMFIESFGIEIEKVSEIPANTNLLITVDCQYGAGNAQKFPCEKFAVIDHHRIEIPECELCEINPQLGSCATLVHSMLLKENGLENFLANEKIRTSLYYGLYTDTNGLSELRHPLDRDLADIAFDKALIKKLKNATITMPELSIVSGALKESEIIENIGLFKAQPCDPNILGFSSDIAMQVDSLDACVLFSLVNGGIKLSVRSCCREIMANELAAFLCENYGSGGGNLEKAGGFLKNSEEYLAARLKEYITAFDKIYAGKTPVDFASMKRYRKLPVEIGFAKSTDLFKDGTRLTVRTMEGDIDLTAGENIYIMIGIEGEIYPILRDKFEKNYKVLDKKYEPVSEYPPTVIDRYSGEKHSILNCAKACLPTSEKIIKAKQIEKRTKVFTYWDLEKYFSGIPGDFLAANENDLQDCYIVNERIFYKTYALI
ncbi:MAG: DHH family phosphoesterase [Fibromonadaceae bacterium]|jgi:phosphoglycolate phosphatase|nr:DHH family phosphoesterase [Fibromonadaceae bacterium]